MSDQSDNLNYFFFVYVATLDLYLFQEIVLLNPCIIFSKEIGIIIYRESNKGNIMLSASNHTFYCSYVFMLFYQYTVFCPW